MASETAEQDELEAQFQTATEELQRAVMRLFQDGDIHPHLVVLALARVTGEVGGARRWRVSRTPRSCWASWPRSCAGPGGSSGRLCGPRLCRPRGTPDQRRPALILENSSEHRNCRLRCSRARRRRSRCSLASVLVLPVWA